MMLSFSFATRGFSVIIFSSVVVLADRFFKISLLTISRSVTMPITFNFSLVTTTEPKLFLAITDIASITLSFFKNVTGLGLL